MKKKMISLFVVMFFVPVVTVCYGQELITNGDFSQGSIGLDSWGTVGDINLVDESQAANEKAWVYSSMWGGASSDVLTIQTNSNDGVGKGVEQYVFVDSYESYTLRFKYGYTNVGSYSSINISYRDINGDIIPGAGYFQWIFDWTTEPDPIPSDVIYNNSSGAMIEKVILLERGDAQSGNSTVVPQEAAYIYISVRQHYAGYRSYFDDISLTPGDNLIVNGSFSEGSSPYGFDGWYAYRGITLVDSSEAGSEKGWVDSAWGIPDVLTIQTSSNDGTGKGVQQYFWLGDADRYILSYKYGYANIGSYSTVNLSYHDISGNPIPGAGYFQKAFDWTDNWGNEDPNPTDVAYNNSSSGLIEVDVQFSRGPATAGNSTVIPDAAVYAYITLKQHYAGYQTYFDDVVMVPVAEECGQSGTVYLTTDLNKDCSIDIVDFAEFSAAWFNCTDPCDPNCDEYWK